MQEINNNKNKKNMMIQELLKKSVEDNKSESGSDHAVQADDTMPVSRDAKAITAKPILTNIKILRELNIQKLPDTVTFFIKRKRLFSVSKLLTFFVFLPTLFVFLYYSFWASPMYISNTKFSVQNTNPSFSGVDISSLLFGGNGKLNNESYVVLEYLKSIFLIKEIDNQLHIIEHYNDKKYDFLTRLSSNPTDKAIIDYWDFAVESSLDMESGIINLNVKAFSPEMAQSLSQALVNKSEELINDMNIRIREDTVKLAHEELAIAEEKVKIAQVAMRKFRDDHSTFDPAVTASGMQSRIAALEAEKTRLETERTQALAIMKKDAPQVKSINVALSAVKKQLEIEKSNVASKIKQSDTISALAAEYEALTLDLKFAQEQQVTAMKALEVARVNQISQSRYLVSIQDPTLPDESLYPEVFLFTFYTFCGTLLGLGLISLVIAAVREHTGF